MGGQVLNGWCFDNASRSSFGCLFNDLSGHVFSFLIARDFRHGGFFFLTYATNFVMRGLDFHHGHDHHANAVTLFKIHQHGAFFVGQEGSDFNRKGSMNFNRTVFHGFLFD
jgi:hypothetical protein